jgi:hypothetical protein
MLPAPSAVPLVLTAPEVAAIVVRLEGERTLRRLWAAGLVELVTGHATRPTLTDQAASRFTSNSRGQNSQA